MIPVKTDPPSTNTAKPQTEPEGSSSFEALARRQGVGPVERFEDLLGGWPAGETDDGFEDAVAAWRRLEREEPTRT